MPYNASEMFVSCGIPSFLGLLRKCSFDFSDQIIRKTKTIIDACLSPHFFLPSHSCGVQYYFNYTSKLFHVYYCIVISYYIFIIFKFSMFYFCTCFFKNFSVYIYRLLSEIKDYFYYNDYCFISNINSSVICVFLYATILQHNFHCIFVL